MLRMSLRCLALAGIAAATLLGPTAAHAADIYKYWAYFGVEGDAFVAQSEGPGNTTPADGTFEAYRYAAPADFNNPNVPRADLSVVTFDAVCADATAAAGQKRVAVLVDYGVESDATAGESTPEPEAACAVVPEDATGLQTLQAAFPEVRTEASSFGPSVCGIEGYPATGCLGTLAETGTPPDGEPVEFAVAGAETEESSASSDDDDNNAVLLGVGAVVVIAIVAGGLFLQRRRNRTV